MDNEPLTIDFKDVKREDKARIKSAIEETANLTAIYKTQLKETPDLLKSIKIAAQVLEADIADDPFHKMYQGMVLDHWQDSLGGTKSTVETLESALKLDHGKKLVGVTYSGQSWNLLEPADLVKIPEEDRVFLSHEDVNQVYVACGGTLENSKS